MSHTRIHREVDEAEANDPEQSVSERKTELMLEVFVFVCFIEKVCKWHNKCNEKQAGHVDNLPKSKHFDVRIVSSVYHV